MSRVAGDSDDIRAEVNKLFCASIIHVIGFSFDVPRINAVRSGVDARLLMTISICS